MASVALSALMAVLTVVVFVASWRRIVASNSLREVNSSIFINIFIDDSLKTNGMGVSFAEYQRIVENSGELRRIDHTKTK